MSEIVRHHQYDSDYDIDDLGLLVYWDCINKTIPLLEPARPIEDPHIIIGKVGQQNLLPAHLSLKPKDMEPTIVTTEQGCPIGDPVPPGISAFLFFGSKQSNQDSLDTIVQTHIGRQNHWKNRFYVAQTADIQKAGWTPYYTPLIDRKYSVYNPLHIILVPNSIVVAGQVMDAQEYEKNQLADVFIKWNC